MFLGGRLRVGGQHRLFGHADACVNITNGRLFKIKATQPLVLRAQDKHLLLYFCD